MSQNVICRSIAATLGSVVVLASLAGCQIYDASLLEGVGRRGGLVPERPDASFEGPDIDPLTYAMRRLIIDQSEDGLWREVGFDLDGLDTDGSDLTNVECLPEGGVVALDGDFGIDNTLGATFFPLVSVAPAAANLEADARLAMEEGRGTMILYVTGYNGQPSDPRVRVMLSTSVAGTSAPLEDVEFSLLDPSRLVMKSNGTPAPPPNWEGWDHWFVRDDGFLLKNFDQPNVVDANAYVVNNRVVMRLPDRASILFLTDSASVDVRFVGGIAVAQLAPDLGSVSDIVIGGRMAIRDILAIGESVGVCQGEPTHDILAGALDSQADLLSVLGASGGTHILCDALSLGVFFESGVVGEGAPVLVASPPLVENCP